MAPTDEDYAHLLELRTGLRRFLHWSEEEARAHGVTPAQHQLLLAIRGHAGEAAPTVSELAAVLLLRHHSVVGLIDRAQAAGLARRRRDPEHPSLVHLELTSEGEAKLAALTESHLAQLAEIAPEMQALWARSAREHR